MNSISSLPIDSITQEVCQQLHLGNVVVQAEPGAGKSTGLPLRILDAGFTGKILMLEPRRIAAVNVASRLAAQLGEPLGQQIGLRMRGRTVTSNKTRLEVVTEGVLTRILQWDPLLEGISLVIFDEFHERSLHADLGLALCLDVQRDVRDDLRLLLMSATLDGESLCRHLDIAAPVTCQVRQHPVDIHWRSVGRSSMLSEVTQTVVEAMQQHLGDVLVFLPGVAEIERVAKLLQGKLPEHTQIHRLHRGASAKAQAAAIAAANSVNPGDSNSANPDRAIPRRIILSTSIAETSITIDGVSIVIDSGIERRSRLDASTGIERLESVMASKASATQRAGRAGRTQAGVCYRLWSEESHATRANSWQAEILRADLSSLLLESGQWGVSDIYNLSWIDPPPASSVARSKSLLQQLEIWSGDGLTPHGRTVARLSVGPRLGHMLIWSAQAGCLEEAAALAALLDEMPGRSNVDLSAELKNLSSSHKRKQKQLIATVQEMVDVSRVDKAQPDPGVLLSQAYPDRIARRRNTGQKNSGNNSDVSYQLSSGSGAVLHEDDPITRYEYIVIANLGGQGKEARVFAALPVDISELLQWSSEFFLSEDSVLWDDKLERVVAERQQRLGALVINRQSITDISAGLRSTALIDGIRKKGVECLNWTEESREWQARVLRLHALEGADSDLPLVDDESLLADLENWLLPYLNDINSFKALKKLDLQSVLHAMLDYRQQQRLDSMLPKKYKVPSGALHKLRYTDSGSPVLAVKLQEMFGCRENPSIANGHVALKIELLSPARRPVQITEDLVNFWHNSYPQVKKDLAGRYPKHPWPDDPLTAEATARAKPRKR